MAKAKVYNNSGSASGEADLKPELFEFDLKKYQVYQYVKTFLSNQRQGTHSTKTRSEVRGGGAKPWRQKGTGRARSGTNRSPIWEGGGIVFGPRPRSYYSRVPKKLRRNALKSMFTDRASEEKVLIAEFPELEKPSTKTIYEYLVALGLEGKRVLVLDEKKGSHIPISCRNLPKVEFKRASLVNAYDIAKAEFVVVSKEGMQTIEEVFSK